MTNVHNTLLGWYLFIYSHKDSSIECGYINLILKFISTLHITLIKLKVNLKLGLIICLCVLRLSTKEITRRYEKARKLFYGLVKQVRANQERSGIKHG